MLINFMGMLQCTESIFFAHENIKKNCPQNFSEDKEIIPYGPNFPSDPKLQIRFMNLGVDLSLYYLSRG